MRRDGRHIGLPPKTLADAVEAAVDGSERKGRLKSLSEAAILLGCDRGTLRTWIEKGMPTEKTGGTGEATIVDLKRVVEWREERARQDERRKYARPAAEDDDGTGERLSPTDRLKEKQILQATQKMAILAKILIHREPQEMAVRQANGLGRQTIMSIPDQIVRKIGSALPEDKVQELYQEAWALCAAGLTSWATEVNAAMKAAAERVIDFGIDEDDA